MVRYVSGSPVSADITAAFRFLNKFEVGAAYRTDQAFSGLMMLNLTDWVDFGYAYENSSRNQITANSNGTHELLVRFNFNKKTSK